MKIGNEQGLTLIWHEDTLVVSDGKTHAEFYTDALLSFNPQDGKMYLRAAKELADQIEDFLEIKVTKKVEFIKAIREFCDGSPLDPIYVHPAQHSRALEILRDHFIDFHKGYAPLLSK